MFRCHTTERVFVVKVKIPLIEEDVSFLSTDKCGNIVDCCRRSTRKYSIDSLDLICAATDECKKVTMKKHGGDVTLEDLGLKENHHYVAVCRNKHYFETTHKSRLIQVIFTIGTLFFRSHDPGNLIVSYFQRMDRKFHARSIRMIDFDNPKMDEEERFDFEVQDTMNASIRELGLFAYQTYYLETNFEFNFRFSGTAPQYLTLHKGLNLRMSCPHCNFVENEVVVPIGYSNGWKSLTEIMSSSTRLKCSRKTCRKRINEIKIDEISDFIISNRLLLFKCRYEYEAVFRKRRRKNRKNGGSKVSAIVKVSGDGVVDFEDEYRPFYDMIMEKKDFDMFDDKWIYLRINICSL